MSTSVEIPFQDVPPGLINLLVGGIVSGEIGYRAYGEAVEWKNYLGQPMPAWDELPDAIRTAWDRAAYAIVEVACRAGEKCGTGQACQCGHAEHFHDVATDGSDRRCCVADCTCGNAD